MVVVVVVVVCAGGRGWGRNCCHLAHFTDTCAFLSPPRHIQGEPVAPRGYRLPRGSVFAYVSAANYFAETIEWCGFAIAAWSPAGGAFVAFTVANLLPRALDSHAWYVKTFGDAYPARRRAMIPFVI